VEPKVAVLLPRATESCKIAGRGLSAARTQPGTWEGDGTRLCHWGKTWHVLELTDFLDWKAS